MEKDKAMDETTDTADTVNTEAAEDRQEEDTQTAGNTEEAVDGAESETAEAAEEENAEEPAQKKGFFAKKKEKKDKKDAQIEELTDRVRRQMAEFDNFRKRTEKEKSAMYEIGARSVVEKILPVVDNFERGLAAAEDCADDPFMEGMQKIYKQLMSTLESMEVKPIEAVGQEFNPDFHNAVMHIEDENLGENVVAEELQKGYLYRDTVVRHSMVKVAN
ncbi:MAG: nucleotide exchange factor GrpE [Lachnospiraceae bacterium]|nr:nucleotide exchange factor GrpE [Lachnospiraceae bacterium]